MAGRCRRCGKRLGLSSKLIGVFFGRELSYCWKCSQAPQVRARDQGAAPDPIRAQQAQRIEAREEQEMTAAQERYKQEAIGALRRGELDSVEPNIALASGELCHLNTPVLYDAPDEQEHGNLVVTSKRLVFIPASRRGARAASLSTFLRVTPEEPAARTYLDVVVETPASRAVPQRVKEAVWKRENRRCIRCGAYVALEFVHILPPSKGGTDSVENLRVLCKNCKKARPSSIPQPARHILPFDGTITLELTQRNLSGRYKVVQPWYVAETIDAAVNVYNRQAPTVGTRDTRYIPQHVRAAVWQRDGGRCVQCGAQELLEYDHILPHSKGGATSIDNLQILCRKCNQAKSASI